MGNLINVVGDAVLPPTRRPKIRRTAAMVGQRWQSRFIAKALDLVGSMAARGQNQMVVTDFAGIGQMIRIIDMEAWNNRPRPLVSEYPFARDGRRELANATRSRSYQSRPLVAWVIPPTRQPRLSSDNPAFLGVQSICRIPDRGRWRRREFQ